MRLLMIGAPGSGKGTQGVRIAEHFMVTHISSGDLLRQHIAHDTPIGRQAREYVQHGDLVPDELVIDMVVDAMTEANKRGGYVLDGFPRTVEQAQKAYEISRARGVSVQVAVHLEVPREILVQRLLARGRGNEDSREVIEHRLDVYEKYTTPLLEYYAQRERLVQVNGSRPVHEVTWSVFVQLERVQRLLRDEEDNAQ
jgi:adenylate kinase